MVQVVLLFSFLLRLIGVIPFVSVNPRPSINMNTARITAMQASAAANTVAWQNLKHNADISLVNNGVLKLENLALVYLVTGDPKYADAAIAGLMVIVNKGPTDIYVTTDSWYNMRNLLPTCAHVYDWCYPRLGANKTTIATYMMDVCAGCWNRPGKWAVNNPTNNYWYGFTYSGLCGLAVLGDEPRAQFEIDRWRNQKWPQMLGVIQGDARGGLFPESTNYDLSSAKGFTHQLDGWITATGEDLLTNQPAATFCRELCYYGIHSTTPDLALHMPFGDESRVSNGPISDYDRQRVLCASSLVGGTTQSDTKWWLDSIKQSSWDWLFWSEFLFYPRTVTKTDYRLTEPLTYFHSGIGMFLARTGWTSNDTLFAAHCGKQSESHTENNAGGFLSYHKDHTFITDNILSHSGILQLTQYFNNVVVNGTPQSKGLGGTILARENGVDYIVFNCDSTLANAKSSTKTVRKIIGSLQSGLYVIVDRDSPKVAGSVDYYQHSRLQPTINGSQFSFNTSFDTVVGQTFGGALSFAAVMQGANPGQPPVLSSYAIKSTSQVNGTGYLVHSLQVFAIGGVAKTATSVNCSTHKGVQIGTKIFLVGNSENIQGSISFNIPDSSLPVVAYVTDLQPSIVYNGVTSSVNGVLRITIPAGIVTLNLVPTGGALPPPPPVVTLKAITITPNPVQARIGSVVNLQATGVGSDGNPFPLTNIVWNTTTGTITQNGVLIVGQVAGNSFIASASSGGVTGLGTIVVVIARFTKPIVGTPINPNHPLSTNLKLFVPMNETSGLDIKELVSGQLGHAGISPFIWKSETTEFIGPVIDSTGVTSVSIPASNLFRVAPVLGYSRAILIKPTDLAVNSFRFLDTDRISFAAIYQGIAVGEIYVGYRNAANVLKLLKFKYSQTSISWLYIGVTVSQGFIGVYANLNNGVLFDGMKLQVSAADCDLYQTWKSSSAGSPSLPSLVYLLGTGGNTTYTPHTLVAGVWMWGERLITANEWSTWYNNPFAMQSSIASIPVVQSVTVTPLSPSVIVGNTQQFTATAKDSSGVTIPSTLFAWSTNIPGASIDGNGLLTVPIGVNVRTYSVSATVVNGVTGSTSVVVTSSITVPPSSPIVLKSIDLVPADSVVKTGQYIQFIATGLGSDDLPFALDNLVWDSEGGEIDQTGLYLVGEISGVFNISVTQDDILGHTTALIVNIPSSELQSGWIPFISSGTRFSRSAGSKVEIEI